MKTNLVDLMSQVSKLTKEVNEGGYDLLGKSTKTTVIELDGHEQVLNDYPEFEKDFNSYIDKIDELSHLKGIIFEKNNSLKLRNGDTIQKTLVIIQNKRKLLDLIEDLARKNPYKRRTSETNNSYFTSVELCYSKEEMLELKEKIEKDIKELELEISQLNAEMFEI